MCVHHSNALTSVTQDDRLARKSRHPAAPRVDRDAAHDRVFRVLRAGAAQSPTTLFVTNPEVICQVLLTMGLQREAVGRGTMAVYVQVRI